MAETIGQDSAPQEDSRDLTDQLKDMSMAELSRYAQGFNVHLSNGAKEGIMIGYLDMETSPERVKVLVDGEQEYWTDDQSSFVKVEPRNWEQA